MASKASHEDSDSEDLGSATSKTKTTSVYHLVSSSNDENLVGNLSKFIVTPPNYNGAIRAGHLMFHSCFQSGNLGRVDCISEFEYDLFVRPDTCNSRYRVWFNFTVQNVLLGQKVIFNIINFSKTKSLYRDGMSPLVKSTSRPNWQRLAKKNVFYYKSPDHHKNYVMSFVFAFDKETDVYQFAYCYPYTYNKLQLYLSNLESMNFKFFKREQLCLSLQQRNVDLVTITSPKNMVDGKQKRIVFFTARVHPGESPSSYVCEGIINFLVSDHPIAHVLRDYLVFMIVPMLNPDGVVLGNYRCSLTGFDLNRYWNEPSPWAQPTIVATKQLLLSMNSDSNSLLDFYIDLHAHSTATNSFMYGNVYENEERFEQQSIFPHLLSINAEDFSYNTTSFNKDALKAGTSRRTLGSCLSEQSNCYTFEVSFFCYLTGSSLVEYTENSYLKLGQNIARTFLDYYKLNNVVTHSLRRSLFSSEEMKKKKSSKRLNKYSSLLNINSETTQFFNTERSHATSRKPVQVKVFPTQSHCQSKSKGVLSYKHRDKE